MKSLLAALLLSASAFAQTSVFGPVKIFGPVSIPLATAGGTGPGGISTGLQLWLRSDSLTCTGGCSGTNVVTAFTDKSANANNCTTSGSPTYLASAVDSLPGVTFNGSNFCVLGTKITWNSSITVFAVFSRSTTTKTTFLSGPSDSFAYFTGATALQGADAAFVAGIGTGTATVDTGVYHQTNVKYDGTTITFRLASAADGSSSPSVSIGDGIDHVACNFGGGSCSNNLEGVLVELIVYETALSDPDRATVEAYIHGRYPSIP